MKYILTLFISLFLVGCSGTTPAVNANSNKIEVFSLSRFINVTNITYSNSLNGTRGTVSQLKD